MKYSGFFFLFAFLFFAAFPQVELAAGTNASVISQKQLVQSTSLLFEQGSGFRQLKSSERLPTYYASAQEFVFADPGLQYSYLDLSTGYSQTLCDFNWPRSRAPPAPSI